MNRKEQQREYLKKKVNPIIQSLVTDLLIKMPDNVLSFMQKWIESKATSPPTIKIEQPEDKDNLSESDKADDEENHDLLTKDQLIAQNPQHKSSRSSVSAEAYGKFNQKEEFVPNVIPKTQEQKDRIKDRLSNAFMFSALDSNEQEIVINAMEEKVIQPGEYVIKQGENGAHLYVVDSGKLSCFKQFGNNPDPTFLKHYEPGDSFGELALLYNAPRAATIKAEEQSVLFVLDRETFNYIVKDATIRKRQEYEEFLSSVELLSHLDAYERAKIADAVKRVKLPPGTHIVEQGEKGDTFYFIEEGEAYVVKQSKQDEAPKEVCQYKPGSYFGELSLLYDCPRQATVIAKTEVKLVSLDRMSFKRLLGPLEQILQRNSQSYENFDNYDKLIV